MSDFELRPVGDYQPPQYPGAEKPGDAPKAPMIANRLSKLAPLALFAITTMPARASAQPPAITMSPSEPHTSTPSASQISPDSVVALVALVQQQQPPPPPGKPAPARGALTEADVASIVQQFLAERGLTVKPAQIVRDGVNLRLVAADATIAVAVTENQAAGALEELALLKARGEMRTLILDRQDFMYEYYEGSTGGDVPSRDAVVRRLKNELERLLK